MHADRKNTDVLTIHGERENDINLIEKARIATQGAFDIYKEAGYSQYNAGLKQRLQKITMLKRNLQ
jgi:hypothetical protein